MLNPWESDPSDLRLVKSGQSNCFCDQCKFSQAQQNFLNVAEDSTYLTISHEFSIFNFSNRYVLCNVDYTCSLSFQFLFQHIQLLSKSFSFAYEHFKSFDGAQIRCKCGRIDCREFLFKVGVLTPLKQFGEVLDEDLDLSIYDGSDEMSSLETYISELPTNGFLEQFGNNQAALKILADEGLLDVDAEMPDANSASENEDEKREPSFFHCQDSKGIGKLLKVEIFSDEDNSWTLWWLESGRLIPRYLKAESFRCQPPERNFMSRCCIPRFSNFVSGCKIPRHVIPQSGVT